MRAVLLVRRARRQHAAPVPATTPPRRSTCPGIAAGETIATLAFTEPTGKWDESGITMEATQHGRRLDAQRHEDVRARRPHRQPDHRRRPHRRRRQPVRRRRATPPASPARPCRPWTRPASRPSSSSPTRPATLIGTDGAGLDRARHGARPRRRRPRRRAGRRRPEGARDGRRVRQGPRAVRPPDRLVPGHQAQVRRHAARGRVGQVGRLLRPVVRGRDERRAALGGLAWPRPTARRRTSTPPPRTSRSTVASASPGSTRPTCTSSGPRAPSCCSATRPTTASCSPSASASDAPAAAAPERPVEARLAAFRVGNGYGSPRDVTRRSVPRPSWR